MNNTELSELIMGHIGALAKRVVDKQYAKFPENLAKFGSKGYNQSIEDAEHNIKVLATSILLENSSCFTADLIWLKNIFVTRNIPLEILVTHLKILQEELETHYSLPANSLALTIIIDTINEVEIEA